MRYIVATVCFMALLPFLCGCGGSATRSEMRSGRGMEHAALLSIDEQPGYTDVKISNPWDSTALLARYILVPGADSLPSELPEGTVLRTPLTSALVFSNVHAALFNQLGHPEAVTGVADAEYITDSVVVAGLAAGTVADCGTATDPDLERIAMLAPQAVMLSPYSAADAVVERLGRTGTPVVMCADYLEPTPLGRAEWMRFYGRLVGEGAVADSLFDSVASGYNHIKSLVSDVAERPSVLIDTRYGDVWYVPVAGSTTNVFITDAGGTNPFASFGHGDSRPLSVEQVLATAGDADIWLVRYFGNTRMSMAEFAALGPEISRFRAFRNGTVYGCNTRSTPYYDVVPFHPQYLLADMARIFHPELADSIPSAPFPFYQPIEQ